MALRKYIDDVGLGILVREIKKNSAKVYRVKGSAIYADSDYLVNPDKHMEIDSLGLWQLIDGTWTKITLFEVGWVYNIINQFKTDSDFIEGAGRLVEAGSNICIAEMVGDPAVYKWDLLGNALDMSAFQTKKLLAPLTVFTNETPIVYTTASTLPAIEEKAAATITEQMVAIMSDPSELGDVYRAHVTENALDPTKNDIVWVGLGNQLTVEGALQLLGKTAPNTPITAAEIEAMFASA